MLASYAELMQLCQSQPSFSPRLSVASSVDSSSSSLLLPRRVNAMMPRIDENSEASLLGARPMSNKSAASLGEESDITLQQSLSDAEYVLTAFQQTVTGLVSDLHLPLINTTTGSLINPRFSSASVGSLLGANQSIIYPNNRSVMDDSGMSGMGVGGSAGMQSQDYTPSPGGPQFNSTTASVTSNMSEASVAVMLEKYSDKLLDLVGDKVARKYGLSSAEGSPKPV